MRENTVNITLKVDSESNTTLYAVADMVESCIAGSLLNANRLNLNIVEVKVIDTKEYNDNVQTNV